MLVLKTLLNDSWNEPVTGLQKQIVLWSAGVMTLWMALVVLAALFEAPVAMRWATLILPVGWQVGVMIWVRYHFSTRNSGN
jgi:hypothetical protein